MKTSERQHLDEHPKDLKVTEYVVLGVRPYDTHLVSKGFYNLSLVSHE